MKNLKIAFRLGIGFGLVTLLMCVLGYSAYTALEQSAASINRINHTYIPILHTASMLRDAVRVADANMRQYEIIGKQEDYTKAQAALVPVPEGLDRLRSLAADIPGLQALQAAARETPGIWEQYRQSSKDTAVVVEKLNGLFNNLIALAGKSETAMSNLEAALFSQREALSAAGNTAALNAAMENINLLSRAQLSFKETRRMVAVARLTYDQAALDTILELANTGLTSLNELGKALDDPRLKALSETAIGAMREYIGSMDSLFQTWKEREKVNEGRHTLEQQLTVQLDSLNAAVTTEADAFTQATVTVSNDVRDQVSMGFAFGAVLAVLLAFGITRSITAPLNRSMAFAQDIAAGHLDRTLNVHSRDEIGKLADALRTLPQVLGNVINEYREIERRVGEGYLGTKGDPHKFSGEFAQLIDGTNSVLTRFTTLMEQLPTAVVVLDSKLNATYLNLMARKLAGDEYTGKSCGELFHREDYGSATDGLQIAVRTKLPSGGETIAHPSAGSLDVSYKVTPFMDAKGNLTSVLQLISDITALQKARRTIMKVADEASGISTGVAATAQHLSKQVSQSEKSVGITSERIAETATAMEEMNSTVLEVARNSAGAADVANEAKNKAEHGSRVVSDVISHIGQMEKQAERMKEDMLQLGSHADAIGAIMTVISDIADQTNLLALNAAIEAARAGDAGRGFAVVADEVRKLAEKTMHATVEVASTIKSVQTSATQNMHNVDESGSIIVQVIELTRQAGESLREIVQLVENSSMQAQAIATAAEEQSAASEEINHSLTAVNTAASQTAEAMTQAAQAVADLSTQAQSLAGLIEDMRKV